MEKPKVTVITPTLNAAAVLEKCLQSIREQNYPQDKIELLIGDGGSTDGTREIAQKYGATIIDNPLKTAESGKAVALKHATGDFIALIDSDNILPNSNWLAEMLEPLSAHPEAVGSEPLAYTWRQTDGFITRYCALIGMNDPLVLFLGNYDRYCTLTGKWTEVAHTETDLGNYLLVKLGKGGLPTIGANGTVFRAEFLKRALAKDYLFDIDILAAEIKKTDFLYFIKTKNSIVHTFCERNMVKFARKQQRRVMDFLYHREVKKDRDFNWYKQDIFSSSPWGVIKFALCGVTFFPLVYQALKGYSKKPDPAWFFHPLACELTLVIYGWYRVFGHTDQEYNRDQWKQ